MAGEILTQDEVEKILSMMSTDTPKPAALGGGGGFGPGQVITDRGPIKPSPPSWAPGGSKVVSYDFKTPDRVGKEQMKTLQTMHEGFGRKFAAGLSALLQAVVEVKLTSVDQLAYSEFIFGLDNPTCFNLLRAEPLEGNLILDINPSILHPMIDRLLGGGREPSMTTRRPLTEIEQRLALRVAKMFLQELKRVWENVVDLEFEIVQTESNPQLIQVVPPSEVVIVLCFEVALTDVRGTITLCIPFQSFERIAGKLSTAWTGYTGRKQATPQTITRISKDIRKMPVLLKVKLAESKMKMYEFLNLRVGDVICTQKNASSPLLVSIEGIPKYWGSPGRFRGFTSIHIQEHIEDPTNIRAAE